MAKNKVGPWYPQIDDSGKSWQYIFLETLQEDNKVVYQKSVNFFNIVSSSLTQAATFSQLNDLLALANRERDKEQTLLEGFVNKGTLSPSDASDSIKGFNKLYQNKKIFERNLKKILAVADGGNQGRIDISSSFKSYLDKGIKDYFNKHKADKLSINKEALLDIVKQSLIFE